MRPGVAWCQAGVVSGRGCAEPSELPVRKQERDAKGLAYVAESVPGPVEVPGLKKNGLSVFSQDNGDR